MSVVVEQLPKKRRLEVQGSPHNDDTSFHLDLPLQRHILSFHVHVSDFWIKWYEDKERKDNATTIKNCTLVCKAWCDMTNFWINESNVPVDGDNTTIISTRELMEIKQKIAQVDLENVRTIFMQQVEEDWGRRVCLLSRHRRCRGCSSNRFG